MTLPKKWFENFELMFKQKKTEHFCPVFLLIIKG